MTIKESLIPKNTEEIKPGFFIQKYGDGYRQIDPMVWDNKVRWKSMILGKDWLKHFIFFIILMFIVYGYVHDNKVYIEQNKMIKENPIIFCQGAISAYESNLNNNSYLGSVYYNFTIKDGGKSGTINP